LQLPGLELFDSVSDGTAATRDYADAGGHEGLVRVWTAVARKDELDLLARHQLRRLNTGTSSERDVWIFDHFERHAIWIDNQEVRTSAEPGIQVSLQCGSRSCDCYFQERLSL
jgi:hypothetical protein